MAQPVSEPSRVLRIKELWDAAENGFKKGDDGYPTADSFKGNKGPIPVLITVDEILEPPIITCSGASALFVTCREEGKTWRLDYTGGKRYRGLDGLCELRYVESGMRMCLLVYGSELTEVYPLSPEISREHDEMEDSRSSPPPAA